MYVLLNPSMPGLVKVGLTMRDAAERARELAGATGVPTDFLIAYEANFEDVHGAEQHMHASLAPFRVNQGREFFRVPPTFAIDTLLELRLQGLYGATSFHTDPVKRAADEQVKFQGQHKARELYEQGQAHELGRGVLKSMYEAIKYYEAAAKAGLPEAHARLGASLLRGYGTEVNVKRGLKTLEKGAALGDLDCLRELAVAHRRLRQPDISVDRWREYFDAAPGTDEAAYYAARFLLTSPRHYRLSRFFQVQATRVLRLIDLIVFADWHARLVERRSHLSDPDHRWFSPLEALSGVHYDTQRAAVALLEELEGDGQVNSSVVLHAARESQLRDLGRSSGQGRPEPPSWGTWEEFDQATYTALPRPERVPPALNNPHELGARGRRTRMAAAARLLEPPVPGRGHEAAIAGATPEALILAPPAPRVRGVRRARIRSSGSLSHRAPASSAVQRAVHGAALTDGIQLRFVLWVGGDQPRAPLEAQGRPSRAPVLGTPEATRPGEVQVAADRVDVQAGRGGGGRGAGPLPGHPVIRHDEAFTSHERVQTWPRAGPHRQRRGVRGLRRHHLPVAAVARPVQPQTGDVRVPHVRRIGDDREAVKVPARQVPKGRRLPGRPAIPAGLQHVVSGQDQDWGPGGSGERHGVPGTVGPTPGAAAVRADRDAHVLTVQQPSAGQHLQGVKVTAQMACRNRRPISHLPPRGTCYQEHAQEGAGQQGASGRPCPSRRHVLISPMNVHHRRRRVTSTVRRLPSGAEVCFRVGAPSRTPYLPRG
ncbi:hypothetical protein DAETH_46230 (plasmid) [Deinococcus aetherius]|uniref:Bacteriophage T5 Orf172 DNA-binding domain-containing protein n=1 Tax=Deinococcus aetherius TaxID=200252 RepID=A0ABM8ALF5_9DEIO|nr:hypothetical protein DAETH_46230 [Deinococcus aetherius]